MPLSANRTLRNISLLAFKPVFANGNHKFSVRWQKSHVLPTDFRIKHQRLLNRRAEKCFAHSTAADVLAMDPESSSVWRDPYLRRFIAPFIMLPMLAPMTVFIILRVPSNCLRSLFTSGRDVPEPSAILLRRLPLMQSGCSRS